MVRFSAAENNVNFCPWKYLPVKCRLKGAPERWTLYLSLSRNIQKILCCKLVNAKWLAGERAVAHFSLTLCASTATLPQPVASGALHLIRTICLVCGLIWAVFFLLTSQAWAEAQRHNSSISSPSHSTSFLATFQMRSRNGNWQYTMCVGSTTSITLEQL